MTEASEGGKEAEESQPGRESCAEPIGKRRSRIFKTLRLGRSDGERGRDIRHLMAILHSDEAPKVHEVCDRNRGRLEKLLLTGTE